MLAGLLTEPATELGLPAGIPVVAGHVDAFASFNDGRGWANATIYWFGTNGNNYATTIFPMTMIETPVHFYTLLALCSIC